MSKFRRGGIVHRRSEPCSLPEDLRFIPQRTRYITPLTSTFSRRKFDESGVSMSQEFRTDTNIVLEIPGFVNFKSIKIFCILIENDSCAMEKIRGVNVLYVQGV